MPIDTSTPIGSWMKRLGEDLAKRRSRYQTLDDYYAGNANLPVPATKAIRESYRRLMRMAGTNYAELVVEAVRERMTPAAFRTGATGDDTGDSEAWRIWQANQLDADAALVHRAMLSMSVGYVIVGGVDPAIGAPLITVEDPREVIAVQDPIRKRRTIAALKVFRDGDRHRAYLYLPGAVFRARRAASANEGDLDATLAIGDLGAWEWESADALPVSGVVPVVAFVNRMNAFGEGLGEFEPHLPLLDRINYTVLSRLEIATMQAYKQRGIKGLPQTDAQGNEIDYDDLFAADPGALWQLPPNADIWESDAVDLGPIRSAVRDDVQDLAAVTRTPLFYLTPEATNGSAEGASLAREGLVFKTQDRLVQTGESWEQVMALAFAFAGDDERARRADMEIIWASPERFSLAERYDAAVKAIAAGVPWRTVMAEVLQYTPQQINRMDAERAADELRLGALAPNAATQVTAGAGG